MNDDKQTTLFDPPPPAEVVKVKGEKGKRCRDCAFSMRHRYRPDWVYCRKKESNRTLSGAQKIKAMDPACSMFELAEYNKIGKVWRPA